MSFDIEKERPHWNAMALAMGADFIEQTRYELFLDVLKTSGKERTIVGGNSMLPTLGVGDLLTVEAGRADEMSSGDIIVCFQAGRFCTHRVLGGRANTSLRGVMRTCELIPPSAPRNALVASSQPKGMGGPSCCAIGQCCRSLSGIPT